MRQARGDGEAVHIRGSQGDTGGDCGGAWLGGGRRRARHLEDFHVLVGESGPCGFGYS